MAEEQEIAWIDAIVQELIGKGESSSRGLQDQSLGQSVCMRAADGGGAGGCVDQR